MDSELARLIDEHSRAVAHPDRWPSPAPGERQSRSAWAAEVARLRGQHDASVLETLRRFGPAGSPPGVGAVRYEDIPLGDATLTGRVYTPDGEPPFPAIAVLHGGGWWMGGGATGFEANDVLCRGLCARLGAVVVNVDYRLAPEHPYPTQLEDAYRSLAWIAEEAAALRVDVARLAVLGISSGGNLAAAACLLARDRGGPALRAQVLITPALDATASAPSMTQDRRTHALKLLVRGLYTHGQPDLTHPYISPWFAPDLSGLPPAVVVIGEYDPLRDEGCSYARRLSQAGVFTTLLRYPMTHTLALPADHERSQRELFTTVAALLHDPARDASSA